MDSFLTSTQRIELKLRHKGERVKRIADRFKAVLALDAGWSYEEVAEILCLDDATVRRFHQIFADEGVEGLARDAYKGGTAKLTVIEEGALREHLQIVTYSSTKEIVAYVENEFDADFTIGGMRHLLRRLGFSYIKPKIVPGKADAVKQREFVEIYADLKALIDDGDRIYFGDACHPIHNAVADYGWMPKGKAKELRTNSGRQRINLNGAIDPVTLDVVVRQEEEMTSVAVVRLLEQLQQRTPETSRIYFICDNASYYKSKMVTDWVETSRITIVYLPAYSPNLNLAERLWKYFRRQVMANTYYKSFIDFRCNCTDFFRNIRHRRNDLRNLMSEKFQTLKLANSSQT